MKQKVLLILLNFLLYGSVFAEKTRLQIEQIQPEQIKSVMAKVADWQLANPSKHHTADWTQGALFAGMAAWAQMADSDAYYKVLLGFGEKNNWQLGKRNYHADDHTVGQMYIEMYEKYKNPKMISGIQERFDYILAHLPDTQLDFTSPNNQYRYSWCDALFMAPPVWAKLARVTGERKYLDYMNKEWWATTDYLFDKEEKLYYRDSKYFEKRETNGEKIFWSRGNGWVLGGLVSVLEVMPEDYPDRGRYVTLYKQMAKRIVSLQPEGGMWHSSLLDTIGYPTKEASGSGFFCYSLAWGINNGLLDEEDYLPAVTRAWLALVGCVHPDGKLGYVQLIGENPKQVRADQTEIYGVGAFLLAGSEVYKISIRNDTFAKKLVVTNPIQSFRDNETISLNLKQLKKFGISKDDAAIFEFKTNRFLVTQLVDDGVNAELLFQTDLAPGEKKCFWVMKQPDNIEKTKSRNTTYCRFVPQRKDDFAWENDKVAFRVYGPALEDETITCGIDTWGKCVQTSIIDKFYKNRDYHTNHGQGGDFYKVGNTLGCGGTAPFIDGKVCLPPHNFKQWKIIANGPIRSIFELTYDPWLVGSKTVRETKRISIDLGSNMNKIECHYAGKTKRIQIASGIVLQNSSKEKYTDKQNVIAYRLAADGKNNGMMGCGVVYDASVEAQALEADGHLLMKTDCQTDKPFVYYAGSCWNKNAEFDTFSKWQQYLKEFKERVDNPVHVKVAD